MFHFINTILPLCRSNPACLDPCCAHKLPLRLPCVFTSQDRSSVKATTYPLLFTPFYFHSILSPFFSHLLSQGYPQALLPLTVAGIPSIHICLDFIPELLAQPQLEKQVSPPVSSSGIQAHKAEQD